MFAIEFLSLCCIHVIQVGEFYYTPNDTTVQFRLASINTNNTSTFGKGVGRRSLSNIERAEKIRKALRYTKVPVLRNRKRTVRTKSSMLPGTIYFQFTLHKSSLNTCLSLHYILHTIVLLCRIRPIRLLRSRLFRGIGSTRGNVTR